MSKLFIQQKVFKITDHYPVIDENNQTIYQVDQDFKLIGFSVNISSPQGQVLCHISRKLVSFLPTFFLNFSDGLELTMKSRFSLFRKKIDVDPDNLGIYIEGNFWDHNYSIYKDGLMIGSIKKIYFSFSDRYELEIFDKQYELLFVSMVIAIDHILDQQASSASSASHSN